MLERFGYSIFSADSISSALNVYSQKNSEIDLVWFDLEIPWIENKISLDTFETCSDISTEKNKEVELSFLDLEMFGIGGKKTFEKFKSYNPGVKVLATCGYLVDGIIDTINEEVEELLVKPFTVIKTLRANHFTAEVPIIVNSSMTGSNNKREAESLGADGFVDKTKSHSIIPLIISLIK